MIMTVDNTIRFNEIVKNNEQVLVKMGASWCAPCKVIDKNLEQLSQEDNDVLIVKVDVDDMPEIAGEYGVMSIPATFNVQNGKIVKSANGVLSTEQLKQLLQN